MKYLKYFLQFLLAIISFMIFKILGPNKSSDLSGKIFELIGPYFRSKKLIYSNISKAYPEAVGSGTERRAGRTRAKRPRIGERTGARERAGWPR